jgi:microcystin-dependent protein
MKKFTFKKSFLRIGLFIALFTSSFAELSAQEGFIGEIRLFAGNFEPRGWAFCNGQILSIAQNTALFSILGTTYGGNGQTTFALPDLRGRVPIGPGQGPGLSSINLGEVSGTESNTITVNQLPAHNHSFTGTIKATTEAGNTSNPSGAYPAKAEVVLSRTDTKENNAYKNTNNVSMAADAVTGTVGSTGQSQPVNNMQPYLGLNYIICLEGVFPARN